MLNLVLLFLLFFSSSHAHNFYILESPPYKPGFFSIFNTVLGALDFVEQPENACIGMKVDFGSNSLYYDLNKGPNWWEYYFEPIDWGFNKAAALKKFSTRQMKAFSLRAQLQMSRLRAYELIQKYVKLKPSIQEKIDTFVTNYFEGYYVIGIHYRGTDKTDPGLNKKGVAPRIAYQATLQQISQNLPEGDFRVFVATDEQPFLEFMQEQFPGRILALDAIRSTNNEPIHLNTSNPPYRKGEEAVMDCVLLSKTQLLIRTSSNLSNCSLKFNPELPVIHLSSLYREAETGGEKSLTAKKL